MSEIETIRRVLKRLRKQLPMRVKDFGLKFVEATKCVLWFEGREFDRSVKVDDVIAGKYNVEECDVICRNRYYRVVLKNSVYLSTSSVDNEYFYILHYDLGEVSLEYEVKED